ncbi:MAG: phage tail protein [Sphingomonas sp.]|nr:phage tail protein [Sphingomonas sp.]
MGKILKILGFIVLAVAAVFTAGSSLIFGLTGVLGTTVAGISLGTLFIGGAVLNFAGSLLQAKPKAPDASPSQIDRLKVSIDARTPRKIIFGSTAMGTDLRDQEFTGTKMEYLHRFVVNASHQIDGWLEIWFDDKLAWSAASGVSAENSGYLTVSTVAKGSSSNAINISARMGSARRYTGLAYTYFRYKLTGNDKKHESPFAQSVPSRVTIIGRGAFLYDPRLDSTVPGGSGSMRANDQTTWVAAGWNDDRCRNPALQMLWYLLGWRIQNPVTSEWLLAVGKGIPSDRIDLQSFITAANLCDEPVTLAAGGTEPRYRSDGVFSEADDPALVLDNLKATMNALVDDVNGKIRLIVLHNDLASPIADFGPDDVIGEFTWQQTPPLNDQFNIIRGAYTDPSTKSLYQPIDYPEVRIASRDGIDRIETINFPLVESSSQAQRLAKQRLQRNLYGGTFKATFQITAWRAQRGDVIRLTFPALGWSNKLFRIAEREIRFDGTVPLLLREENAAIYLWDSEDSEPVQAVEPTTYNQIDTPFAQAFDDANIDITAAQAAADSAIGGIDDLGDDGKLTPSEKIRLVLLNTDLFNAYTLLDTAAAVLIANPGVATAKATADTAWSAWVTYRDTLSPAWNNTTMTTAITRSTYNGKLNDLQYAIDALAETLRKATASNTVNLVRFSGFEQGFKGWFAATTGTQTAGYPITGTYLGKGLIKQIAEGFSGASRFLYMTQTSDYYFPVVAGQRYAVQARIESQSLIGTVQANYLRLAWYDGAGAYITETDVQTPLSGPQTYGTLMAGFVTAPAGSVKARIVFYVDTVTTGQIEGALYEPMVTVATPEQTEFPAYSPGQNDPLADQTIASQITLAIADVNLAASSTGVITSGQLPKVVSPILNQGSTSIVASSAVTWSVDMISSNLTGQVPVSNTSGTKGQVTIGTGVTGSGTFRLVATISGVPYAVTVAVNVNRAGGTFGGNPTNNASGPLAGYSVNNTTTTEIARFSSMVVASGETIYCTASGDYSFASALSGTSALVGKWQYSLAGANSWTDIAGFVTGTAAGSSSYEPNPDGQGSITVAQNKSGLSANTYDVRFVAARQSSSPTGSVTFDSGTLTVGIS